MSEIKELIKNKDSVLVFDIDGVLAVMEFSKYNHFIPDEEWEKYKFTNQNVYTIDKVSNKMKLFLDNRDINRVYVVTKADSLVEGAHKKEFANLYYNIPIENIYCVKSHENKKDCLIEIKQKYLSLEDKKIIMIDDSVENLNDIMENTKFSTAHISSFLDI